MSVQHVSGSSRIFVFIAILAPFLALLFPLILANSATGVLAGLLVLVVVFVLPGYVLASVLRELIALKILLAPIFGIVGFVTIYDLAVRRGLGDYFPYLVAVLSCGGLVMLIRDLRRSGLTGANETASLQDAFAGSIVALLVAPLYWRSGRFSNGDFVFYGPAGQDPLFHVTLLQRLLHHVPPDNFIMAGMRAPVYHYFDDLTLALSLTAQRVCHLGTTDVFDFYYRCYPTLLYFLLGAFAYRVGRKLGGNVQGGVLGVAVLLGGGGLGPLIGLLRTAAHSTHLGEARSWLFSEWGSWNGVDALLPLVHRPAHYHGLLICLAALSLLLQPLPRRRNWIASGLLLGLMVGFNFTLAATFGVASVLASIILWWRRYHEAKNIVWLSIFILIGSLPLLLSMLLSGFHNPAPGFPFRGPNLEFTTGLWGETLKHFMPNAFISIAALVIFPLMAYGVRLLGVPGVLRANLGDGRCGGFAHVLAIVFLGSFVFGTFFPYKALGGVAVIFIQPTLWVLGLLSIVPIASRLRHKRASVWHLAIWGLLIVTWAQAFLAFNFGRKAVFSAEAVNALRGIGNSTPDGRVVAFMPTELDEVPVLGHGSESTNFAITALTGLDGYFSAETYSVAFSVPGLHGRDDADIVAQAEQIYQRRRDDVKSFLSGKSEPSAASRLAADHVCWIIASGRAQSNAQPSIAAWKQTSDMAIYKMCQ